MLLLWVLLHVIFLCRIFQDAKPDQLDTTQTLEGK